MITIELTANLTGICVVALIASTIAFLVYHVAAAFRE